MEHAWYKREVNWLKHYYGAAASSRVRSICATAASRSLESSPISFRASASLRIRDSSLYDGGAEVPDGCCFIAAATSRSKYGGGGGRDDTLLRRASAGGALANGGLGDVPEELIPAVCDIVCSRACFRVVEEIEIKFALK